MKAEFLSRVVFSHVEDLFFGEVISESSRALEEDSDAIIADQIAADQVPVRRLLDLYPIRAEVFDESLGVPYVLGQIRHIPLEISSRRKVTSARPSRSSSHPGCTRPAT